jgi:orotate phosphoribosyltransferase
MKTPREQLLRILALKSFRLGEFKLSSGATSDYYIDCRATTLDAEGLRLTSRVLYDEIIARDWRASAIGGLTLGADPIVAGVSMLSAQQMQGRNSDRPGTRPSRWYIDGFIVRKSEKEHGTGQRIEGYREKGAEVVVVDDVCTTGGSTIQAIQAAREHGFKVLGVICLVERVEAGGRAAIEQAAAPAPFVAIYSSDEVREEHLNAKEDDPLHAM